MLIQASELTRFVKRWLAPQKYGRLIRSTAGANGAKFDSSEDRGQPEEFPIGARRVIVGKEEAVTGMRIGGVRRVVMPPELGYGSRGRGEIPPNATLVYEIRLTEIKM